MGTTSRLGSHVKRDADEPGKQNQHHEGNIRIVTLDETGRAPGEKRSDANCDTLGQQVCLIRKRGDTETEHSTNTQCRRRLQHRVKSSEEQDENTQTQRD